MEGKFYTNEKGVLIVITLLKAHGIRKVIASPGTTNITLVASMQQDPWFEMYSAADERSAAYMACGLAAESNEPVVLSCTGATASRNYMPGLTEAFYRKLPVLAITSNLGQDWIGRLLPQIIDRNTVPNDIVMESVFLPFCKDEKDVRHCEIMASRAILTLFHKGGAPAHINLTTSASCDYSVKTLPDINPIRRYTVHSVLPPLSKGKIGIFIGSHKTWTEQETKALESFCESHNAIAYCDNTSGYCGKFRITHALIGAQHVQNKYISNIDILIHIGSISGDYYTRPTAKEVWRVSEDGAICDTFGTLTKVFEMPEKEFFKHYTSTPGPTSFLSECRETYENILAAIPDLPFSNIWAARMLHRHIPSKSVIHFGILNSLRAWNFFELPEDVQSSCNVGGFGIDGNISSLIGASLANPNKLYYGVVGDLAFFYDMNALGNRHIKNNVRILLINNGKGTEFRNYDHIGNTFQNEADVYIAAAGHYGNKSPLLVKHYAEDLGFDYLSASEKESFMLSMDKFINPVIGEKPILFEIFTNSDDESQALHLIRTIIKSENDNTQNGLVSNIYSKGKRFIKKIVNP